MENTSENKNKKNLGRGLGSLLGGASISQTSQAFSGDEYSKSPQSKPMASQPTQEKTIVIEQKIDEDKRIWSISVDKIVPGLFQPRKKFDKEPLAELSQSIKENGILQPIVVRKRAAGGFEIIAGERRWRAAQLAGLHEVPALIKNFSDQESLQMALIENIQREDLDPIEEAESYQRLIEEFNLSQQQAAEKVGKERSSVANALRLLALPFEIKNMMANKSLTVGHAKVLLSVDNKPEQIKLAKLVVEKNLSVRALEQALKSTNKQNQNTKLKESKDLSVQLADQLAQNIQKKLGTKTEISYNKGKGQIVIHFYSDEQLNGIYEGLSK